MMDTDRDLFGYISAIITKISNISPTGISAVAILYIMSYFLQTRPILVSFLVICAYLCIGYICSYIYTKFQLEDKNGEGATVAAVAPEQQPTDLFDDDIEEEEEVQEENRTATEVDDLLRM
jgi:hypothetical protein